MIPRKKLSIVKLFFISLFSHHISWHFVWAQYLLIYPTLWSLGILLFFFAIYERIKTIRYKNCEFKWSGLYHNLHEQHFDQLFAINDNDRKNYTRNDHIILVYYIWNLRIAVWIDKYQNCEQNHFEFVKILIFLRYCCITFRTKLLCNQRFYVKLN